jgi:hypothetical protein
MTEIKFYGNNAKIRLKDVNYSTCITLKCNTEATLTGRGVVTLDGSSA